LNRAESLSAVAEGTEQKVAIVMEPTSKARSRVLDKRLLQRSVASLYERLGLRDDPNATGEQAQEMSLRDGVRPEDRIGSSEILRVRYAGKEQADQ
jgi:hypothetical protein